jgi:dienelactone hydrolase
LKRLVVAFVCGTFALAADARRGEAVTFPSLDRDAQGARVVLQGLLFLPRTAVPTGGFPAVVALHGCGGMYSTRAGRERDLAERMALRAELLLREGYAVLFADSFRARGVGEVCTIRHAERTVTATRRRLDALGALAYLASRRDVARDRIALVGWSHGGSTALQAINVRDRTVADFFGRGNAPPMFRAVVAFYPGCATPLRAGERYRPGAPTRIHIGELDDWTPARPCVELGAAMEARAEDFVVTTYAGSHHAFDAPGGPLVHRTDVPNGVQPGQGVHVGPNGAAREAANASVRAFLRERLSH